MSSEAPRTPRRESRPAGAAVGPSAGRNRCEGCCEADTRAAGGQRRARGRGTPQPWQPGSSRVTTGSSTETGSAPAAAGARAPKREHAVADDDGRVEDGPRRRGPESLGWIHVFSAQVKHGRVSQRGGGGRLLALPRGPPGLHQRHVGAAKDDELWGPGAQQGAVDGAPAHESHPR